MQGWNKQCRQELAGIEFNAPTIGYVGLNLSAALFDNAWMLLYTIKGPAGFWAFSTLYAPNDLELSLIKPAVGSLTVSVVVFLGTLVARRKMPAWLGASFPMPWPSYGSPSSLACCNV
eukprot:scaffold1707_cov357-Prasinococcus_capsulatus_cf.AAC.15